MTCGEAAETLAVRHGSDAIRQEQAARQTRPARNDPRGTALAAPRDRRRKQLKQKAYLRT